MYNSKLPDILQKRQNVDGGWGYAKGVSWAEPTALAVLALHSCGLHGATLKRGVDWLRSRQRPDGGWAPTDVVANSCSVTTTCLLALGCAEVPSKQYSVGLRWALGQAKRDYTAPEGLLHWLQRVPSAEAATSGGCPWFPGTASWVAPTVMMTLAFCQSIRLGYSDPELHNQIERARRYLLSRRCPDGGWNHGGTQYRSPNPPSYPEMTGLGLLAFERADAELAPTIQLGLKMANNPGSSEAQSLLTMALPRFGCAIAAAPALPWRTTRDLALQILSQSGQANPLLV